MRETRRRFLQQAGAVMAAAPSLGFDSSTRAQGRFYPSRLIKIVVPFPAGGPTDVIARLVVEHLSATLGQNVVVENQAGGAGGRVGTKAVASASPDGYTLLLGGTNTNAITPAVYRNIDFDPINDFVAVAPIATDSLGFVATPAVPATTLGDFIAYARRNPGKVTAGATVGIAPHLALALLGIRTGIKLVFVPYRGAAPVITDLLGGQIDAACAAKSGLLPHIQSGKARLLAVTSKRRWSEFPEAPTLEESGMPGFPTEQWFGLLAPAGTPQAAIDRINSAVNEGLRLPGLRSSIAKLGLEARTGTAQEFAAVLASDVRKWATIAAQTGVRIE
jgi:tripartite-type tricarboxylate transporter receptor subunit TctC